MTVYVWIEWREAGIYIFLFHIFCILIFFFFLLLVYFYMPKISFLLIDFRVNHML